MFQNQTLSKKIELGSYLNHPANIVSSIQDEKTYEIRSGIQRQSILELSLYSLDFTRNFIILYGDPLYKVDYCTTFETVLMALNCGSNCD